jgi:hypothetical protein
MKLKNRKAFNGLNIIEKLEKSLNKRILYQLLNLSNMKKTSILTGYDS